MNSVAKLGEELWALRVRTDPWDDSVIGASDTRSLTPQTSGLYRTAGRAHAIRTEAETTMADQGHDGLGYAVIAEQALDLWVKANWQLLFRFVNGYDYSILGKLFGTYAQMRDDPRTTDQHQLAVNHIPDLLEQTAYLQIQLAYDGWSFAPSALRAARHRLGSPQDAADHILGTQDVTAHDRTSLEVGLDRYDRALEYLAKRASRPETAPGLVSSEGGTDLYKWLIRIHTGQHTSPSELMEHGQERIAHLNSVGSRESAEPRRFSSRSEMRDHAAQFSQILIRKVSAISGTPPLDPPDIRDQPPGQSGTAPLAYYVPAGEQPATLHLDTDAYAHITVEDLECVLTHEVAPGHHFQFSQYAPNLPRFRSTAWFTSMIEGWGLFAEQLSIPMGLVDPDRHGSAHRRQNLLRAARMVVDPGLHAKGWSYDQAVRYLQDTAELTPDGAAREVDRYLEYPGQALAYESGRAQISQMLDPHDMDWSLTRTLLHAGTLPLTAWRSVLDDAVT